MGARALRPSREVSKLRVGASIVPEASASVEKLRRPYAMAARSTDPTVEDIRQKKHDPIRNAVKQQLRASGWRTPERSALKKAYRYLRRAARLESRQK